jgi:hypothetical protein
MAAQLASFNVAIVSVCVVNAFTETVVCAVLELNDCPFDNVPFQGPEPARLNERTAGLPGHTEVDPEMEAVGLGSTLIATLLPVTAAHGLLVATTR